MGRALAALAALLVVVTDARPVADPERPFARVRASDDARYSDADAPLMMFPSAQLDGRLWARHADGAWARGEGRWRDANVAMAKYARVHRAVLEAEGAYDLARRYHHRAFLQQLERKDTWDFEEETGDEPPELV